MSNPTTLYDKIWNDHLVHEADDGTRVPSESTPVSVQLGGDGEIRQPEPAPIADRTDGGLFSGGTGSAFDGSVSPLRPVTDLLSGVTSVIPGPETAITGAPGVADEGAALGQRTFDLLKRTVRSLPGAGTGVVTDITNMGGDDGNDTGGDQ